MIWVAIKDFWNPLNMEPFLLVGLFFIIYSLWVPREAKRRVAVEGLCVEVVQTMGRTRHNGRRLYRGIFEYTYCGREYRVQEQGPVHLKNPKAGECHTLYVKPEDPEVVMLDTALESAEILRKVGIIMLIIGPIMS